VNGNPGCHRKVFGGTTATALSDGCLVLPNEALLGIEPAEAGGPLQAAFRGPAPRTSVNAFLVQSGGRTVLVDTGAGTETHPTLGRLPNSLAVDGVGRISAAPSATG